MQLSRYRWALVALLLAFTLVAGCEDDSDSSPGTDTAPDTTVTADTALQPGPDAATPDAAGSEDVPAATADVAPDIADDVPPRPTGPWEVPSGPVDMTFHAGPYLGHTTTTSVVVSWVTEIGGDSVVEFGLDESYGGRTEGAFAKTHGTVGEDKVIHEVLVDGLTPETLYHYRACTGETCTGDLTFATAPLPGRSFRFAVYSDTQTGYVAHGEVSESIRQSLPAVVLHAGDVVGLGSDRESYITEYLEPARQRSHYVPTYLAVGNHDWKDLASRVQNFRDFFAHPVDPDVPTPEATYSFTYGDMFVIVLDNTIDGGDFFFPLGGGTGPALWDWLQDQATSEAAQTARWRFAVFHYPPDSACQEQWMNMKATQDVLLPLLRDNGFQAVFAGHTHEYEHQMHHHVHTFITGGGGGGLDTDDSCTRDIPSLQLRHSAHHHLTIDLGDEDATVRAVGTDGAVIDTVTVGRVLPE